ncbi:hypothetical protein HDE_11798 [Halotydeus destructor]|nr:hypothetical protein HDE_11798 [Halotydeus destructor]
MASKVVCLVFTLLFLAFVALLVCLAAFAYDHTKEEQFKNANHQDEKVRPAEEVGHDSHDLTVPVNHTCPICPQRSLRDHFCSANRFALLVTIVDEIESNDRRLQQYKVARVKSVKRTPYFNGTIDTLAAESVDIPAEECEHDLDTNARYLVTGLVKPENSLVSVEPCDIVLNWKDLYTEQRKQLIDMFNQIANGTLC